MTDVMVPSLGESVSEATVSTWFKKPGDAVAVDEMLCELETDKVSVEVPSPVAGVLAEIIAPEGTTVAANARLAIVTEGAASSKTKEKVTKALDDVPSTVREPSLAPIAGPEPMVAKDVEDAPAAKKAMAEAGLTRDQVTGTGRDGRVMKEDVAKAVAAPAPAPIAPTPLAPAQAGAAIPRAPVPADDAAREERVKMTRLRATIARRLKDAQNTAAMLTTYNEVDMSAIMSLRNEYKDLFEKKHGVKLGFMSFFVKAVAQALKDVPSVNGRIDGTDIIENHFYDIGVAIGTDKGLMVPILRDVDQKSFAQIEKDILDYAKKAKDGKMTLEDLTGGVFTISNGGTYGSLLSTPILNPPQSGILGMHTIQQRPVALNGQVVIRPMMYLALSYDHRLVDGKEAVTFLIRIKDCLENPTRLLLEM